MRTYLLKRLLLLPVTLVGITFLTFCVIQLAPGDPASLKRHGMATGAQASAEQRRGTEDALRKFRERHGLDKPMVKQYFVWLGKVCTLDLGNTFFGDKPVIEEIRPYFVTTLLLEFASLLLIYAVAIPVGIASAWHPGSTFDRVSGTALFILYSLPSFWAATMLILWLGNPETAPFGIWFPASGIESPGKGGAPLGERVLDLLHHAVLPVLCLSYTTLAAVSRYMRTGMLEVIRQDFVRTARAKGLTERRVMLRHVLRNALFPIVTFTGQILPALVTGSIIIESVFNVPGMGWWAYDAINRREYNILMAVFLISGLLTLVGIFLADIAYGFLDPRISYDTEAA